MSIQIYNVLSNKIEIFNPIEKGKIKMYACGITVSDNAYIGHAFQALVFDMIKRYFEYLNYDVTYVRNYTDVDDKIIKRANELKVNPVDYAERLIIKTDHELKQLGISEPTITPKATEHITDMINFIAKLIERDYAYSTEIGNVYFSVCKFKEYGKLSNRNIEDSISGTRKDLEPDKLDVSDFALWKRAKPEEISWKSPWGDGRPGWHIECSTMSMKYLGETIDIHGGGKDLIFPHHENEIAQSEALTNKKYSNFWVHNGLIKVNGQKMGKSLGNSILLSDLLRDYHPDVIRFALLKNTYSSDINVVDGIFEEAEKHVYHFYNIFSQINELSTSQKTIEENETSISTKIQEEFIKNMNNNFNTAVVFASIFGYFEQAKKLLPIKKHQQTVIALKTEIIKICEVFNILQLPPNDVIKSIKSKYLIKNSISENEILLLLQKRAQFKKEKDYQSADKIREELALKGISVKDGKETSDWDINY